MMAIVSILFSNETTLLSILHEKSFPLQLGSVYARTAVKPLLFERAQIKILPGFG